MAKYLVVSELREIATLLDSLNQNMGKSDIAIGKAPIYDANGDTLGHIDICEGGMYAFILSGED